MKTRKAFTGSGKHYRLAAMLQEEHAVGKDDVDRNKEVEIPIWDRSLKLIEGALEFDIHNRHNTLDNSLQSYCCQRITIYYGNGRSMSFLHHHRDQKR